MVNRLTLLLFLGLAFWVCEDQPEDCAGVAGGDNICGCTDSTATNYDSTATFDDESCEYDTTPPTVTITSPQDDSTISDSVTITCMSTDNESVKKVELWVDGVNTGVSDNTEPYSLVWNTTTYDDGLYTIIVRSYDASGNTTDSEPITLIVYRAVEDCETYYNENVAPILSSNCIACHSGATATAGLSLDSYTSVYSAIKTGSVLDRVNRNTGDNGFMPQGGQKLSNANLDILQTFFEMECNE
jgi:hypothetical protein